MSNAVNFSFEPVDNARLANLCGAFDENLRQIETALEVNIVRCGERFTITGEQANLARVVLERFYLEARHDITLERLQFGLIESMQRDLPDAQSESVLLLMTRKSEVRGRTLNHSFIILDEAQNTTQEQMKMFPTRISFGSKAVITGDVTQIDLARGQKSGLNDARVVLKDARGIAFQNFLAEDVVRHPLVQKIVFAYEKHEQHKS